MLIYQGTTDVFVRLNRMNRIVEVMDETFFSFTGRHAGQSEYNSWQNSLTRVRDLVEVAELKENYIALEYSVPDNNQSRIDCLLFGKSNGQEVVFLVEPDKDSSPDTQVGTLPAYMFVCIPNNLFGGGAAHNILPANE